MTDVEMWAVARVNPILSPSMGVLRFLAPVLPARVVYGMANWLCRHLISYST